MNKKGFTLVELITSFSLATVIIFLLINVVLILKDLYSNYNLKTELLINQSNLSRAMNSKINNGNLISYSSCDEGDYCYEFAFTDSQTIKLVVTSDSIKFGDFVYKVTEGTSISAPSITKENISVVDTSANNSFLIIRIPITNKLFDENFGINLIYPYNSNRIAL